MRQSQPRPKDHRLVDIPDPLRDAMCEVHQILIDAKRNGDVRIDFDDAIQVDRLCGGRCGDNPKRPFRFTYYPPDDADRGRWFLTLHRLEIEDIADGVMTAIKLYCCTTADCRTKAREAGEHCFYCDYVDVPATGTAAADTADPVEGNR